MGIARTHEAAAGWPCPLARTFADPKANAHCRGEECPLWRWTCTGAWREAVLKVKAEIGEKQANAPQASAIVAKDPRKYGCEGYCGLGGGAL